MRQNPLFTLSLLAMAVSQAAYAKDEKQTEEVPVVLEKVVVIDQKPPTGGLNHSIIKPQEIKEKQPHVQDTARLLEDIPGVSFQANGGVSSLPVIRGFNDDRIKTEVDGMTIASACGNHMNPPMSYIDRTNIGKVDVLRGITPVSMGGDSIGGTIVVESADPVFAEAGKGLLLNGKLSGFYRSNGDAFGGSMTAGVANQNARLEYTGSHSESQNYNDGNGNIIESTAYENQNHAVKLAYKLDNHLFEFKGGQQHIPLQGFPNQRMDMLRNDSIFGNLHYKGEYDWGKLDGRVYLENTNHYMDIGYDKLYPQPANTSHSRMPMDVRGQNLGYKLQAEIPFGQRDTLRVGNEFHANKLNEWWNPVAPNFGTNFNYWGGMWPDAFRNLNNASRDRLGTFVEWEANWTSEVKSLVGLRYDHTMMDAGNINGYVDAGVVNSLNRASLPNPMMSPTMNTLPAVIANNYWTQKRYDSAVKALNEASAWNGMSHERNFDTFDVSALLQYTPNRSSQYEFGYARKNRAPGTYDLYPWSTSGMMMSMMGSLYKDQMLGEFATRTTMGYVRGERMDGGNLYHMMPFNAKLALDHKKEAWRNSVEMQFVDGKSDVQQIRNELTTPAYILLNAKTSYTWKNLTVDVGLDNVLDKQYYHPLAGVNAGDYYAMSISMPDPGYRNNRNLAGLGRSAFVGFTLTY